ncbi:hypothetical protein [Winogradskyella luteola]|uniref:Outer membrane insertion C-signal n=1 Tax=Winogradskyella luteola TaxID=2828330 RepID=A0A9X1F9R6_9FLAO|nr:hypothetical protein [Winogradskyella luteola]MBV7269907.1 hypothetical protein [Winogradskyella luteola]
MKNIILAFTLLITTVISAQEIGVRFGEVTGNNVAIDGVFDFEGSRIHANVSFGEGVGIDALYDFIYKPIGEEAINWYAGVGASTYIEDDFNLGVSGEIGLEYVFKEVPIVLGIDYRPTFWIIDDTDFKWDGFGINVRYKF